MRLTLVLPRHRLWRWHLDLIEHLRMQGLDVSVVVDGGARPYPQGFRAWLRLEHRWLGNPSLAQLVVPDPNWPDLATLGSDAGPVVNLSEREIGRDRGWELRFDGALSSDPLIAALLRQRQPILEVRRLEGATVPARSRPSTEEKHYLARSLESCFARAASLILRSVDRPAGIAPPLPPPRPVSAQGCSLPAFACRSVLRKAMTAALRPVRRPDHWTTALRIADGPFRPIDDDGKRYFADPFLKEWDGKRILFLEEYDYASGRGHLSAAEVRGDRLLAPPVPILECPYHLSYPHVFDSEGSHFMIPESGANRSVDLYRATAGPWSWEKVGTLLEGRVFADATPLFHEGRWWLFVAADSHGTATQDELQLYVGDRLTGPYDPHPLNPIVSDCRFARPAGRIRRHGDRLLRPAQDCEASYGAGIAWFVIEDLTPTTYRERLLTVWSGPRDFGTRGVHSFDQLEDLQAIDLNGTQLRGRLKRRSPPFYPRSGGEFDTTFLADVTP